MEYGGIVRQLVALSSVMVLTFVGARPAHADSDGYYCIGRTPSQPNKRLKLPFGGAACPPRL